MGTTDGEDGPLQYSESMGKRFTPRSRGDPMDLDAIEKHREQRPRVKQGRRMSKPYKLNPDEQRLANVTTVVNLDTLQGPARNLNGRGRKLQQWIKA
jgi:hypothetical protein